MPQPARRPPVLALASIIALAGLLPAREDRVAGPPPPGGAIGRMTIVNSATPGGK